MGILERAVVNRIRTTKVQSRLVATDSGRIELSFWIRDGIVWKRNVERPENHCLMRAFDKMLREGNPDTGKIGVLQLFDPSRGGLRCPASFAVTDRRGGHGILQGRRFILFPSWMPVTNVIQFKNSSGEGFRFDAHHVTYESNSDGTLSCHATSVDGKEHRNLARMKPDEDGNFAIGDAFMQNHLALDAGGFLTRSIELPCEPHKLIEKWGTSLRRNFPHQQPVLFPPDIYNKDDCRVLMMRMRLGGKTPRPSQSERISPVCFSDTPKDFVDGPKVHRDCHIRIYSDLYLSLSVFRMNGVLQSDSVWLFEG